MNGDELNVAPAAFPPSYTYTPPTWPPPSGGAPVSTPELGPITNPFPYGSTQTPNISTAPPSPPAGYPPPFGGQPGTFYPAKMPPKNGQVQPQLPVSTKPWEVGPIKADPSISAGKPPYIMGPGPQGQQPYEVGPMPGNPAPPATFPAGSWLDGFNPTPL